MLLLKKPFFGANVLQFLGFFFPVVETVKHKKQNDNQVNPLMIDNQIKQIER